jgi:hypothetical protein
MGVLDRTAAADVRDAKSYAAYVQQQVGVPYCSKGDVIALNKAVAEFKERYPHLANNPWPTLVRAANWVRSKRKRPAKVAAIVNVMIAWAWADGALPELDPRHHRDEDLEVAIADALQHEADPRWRDRLIGAEGPAREEVLRAWMRKSSLSPA